MAARALIQRLGRSRLPWKELQRFSLYQPSRGAAAGKSFSVPEDDFNAEDIHRRLCEEDKERCHQRLKDLTGASDRNVREWMTIIPFINEDPNDLSAAQEALLGVGVRQEDIKAYPELLTVLPSQIHRMVHLMKDLKGPEVDEERGITLYVIRNVLQILRTPLPFASENGLTMSPSELRNHLIDSLQAPSDWFSDVQEDSLKEGSSTYSLMVEILAKYLSQRFCLTPSEGQIMCQENCFVSSRRSLVPAFYMVNKLVLASSFANLRKSIEILETEFKLPLSMLLGKPHRPLMLCPPENLLELLSMPSLAGRSPVEALTNFPFLGMYTPEKIKRLEKIMNTVPDFRLSHIKLLKPIYNLHPDTMEERMEYALSNWPTVKYPGRTGEGPDPDHILLARGSPEVWRRTKLRYEFLTNSLKWKNIPPFVLWKIPFFFREIVEQRPPRYYLKIRPGGPRFGSNVDAFIEHTLKMVGKELNVTVFDVKSELRNNLPQWRILPFDDALEIVKLLLAKGFEPHQIFYSIPIICYRLKEVEAVMEEAVSKMEELFEDGPKDIAALQVLVYFADKSRGFTCLEQKRRMSVSALLH